MWTHVHVCEGPYHPLRFGRRGCCFYKSENTESDLYTASPYGLVDLQLPHSSDRGYHIPSQCLLLCCTLHKWYSHAPQPCAPTVVHQPTIRTQINKLAFCSSLTTSTLVPKPYYTDSYFLTLNGPHRTHTQMSPKARSPTACIHITTRSQTNHSQMDVLPAHLNRDSFRDFFKRLVALEIIFDLPIGFPINHIISLWVCSRGGSGS